MRVVYSEGKWVPLNRSTTVQSNQSKTDYHDAQRIRESSTKDSTKLTGNYVNDTSKPLTSSEFGMGSGVHRPFVGSSEELRLMTNQARQQQQMILELQKQIDNLAVIQQQQKLLEEEVKRRKQAQMTQEQVSTIKGAVSTQVQSKNADVEMVSTDSRRSGRVHQRNQKRIITRSNGKDAANAEQHRRLREVSRHPQQTNRVDKSEVSSRKKKQVRLTKRVKRCNSADDKDPTVRGNSKTFPCSECDKQFLRKSHLLFHLRIHTGERPFSCGECGSTFNQKSYLTVHRRIHSGEKPFKCQICDANFNRKHHLSQHLLIHTNEKPFTCDICQKSFREKRTLSDHMNLHSDLKPHKCNVCKKTFHQRCTLSSHRKVHH